MRCAARFRERISPRRVSAGLVGWPPLSLSGLDGLLRHATVDGDRMEYRAEGVCIARVKTDRRRKR